MDKQGWRSDALCASLTPEQADDIFFFGPGKSSRSAKLYCSSCPVRQECGEFAILYGEQGAWAGMTDAERDAVAPMLRPVLHAKATANGSLEDHDVSHFIPQPRQLLPLVLDESLVLVQEPAEVPLEEYDVPIAWLEAY